MKRWVSLLMLLGASLGSVAGPIRYDVQITNDWDWNAYDHAPVDNNQIGALIFPGPDDACSGACHQRLGAPAAASGRVVQGGRSSRFFASRLQLHFYGDTANVTPYPDTATGSTGSALGYYLDKGRSTFSNAAVGAQNLSGVLSGGIGYQAGCALTNALGVTCWGYGTNSVVPPDNFNLNEDATAVPTPVTGFPGKVSRLSVGYTHACALSAGGAVSCWGDNSHGQLGNQTSPATSTPQVVSGLPGGVVSVLAGSDWQSCAITSGGAAWCWGANYDGQLGNGSTIDSASPVPVTGLSRGVVQIASGGSHSCAVLASGNLACWGYNWDGQLGVPTTTTSSFVPLTISLPQGRAINAAAGAAHTCAVANSGDVYCWGYNGDGELGNGTLASTSVPTKVTGLPRPARSVASGGSYSTCALLDDGSVWCWGAGSSSYFAFGNVPSAIQGLSGPAIDLSVGFENACAVVARTRQMECWGYSYHGALGRDGPTDRAGPVQLPSQKARMASGSFAPSAGLFVSVDTPHHAIGIGSGWPAAIAPGYPAGSLQDSTANVDYTSPEGAPYILTPGTVDTYDLKSAFGPMAGFTVANVQFPAGWPATNPDLPLIGGGALAIDPMDPRARSTTYFTATPLLPADVFLVSGKRKGRPAASELSLQGSLTLGSGAAAFDPAAQDLVLGVGPFTAMLPAGSFQTGGAGSFSYSGTVSGARLTVSLSTRDGLNYAVSVSGENVDLSGLSGAMPVELYIGDNFASATLNP